TCRGLFRGYRTSREWRPPRASRLSASCSRTRNTVGCSAGSCWQFSPCGSCRDVLCCGSSRCPGSSSCRSCSSLRRTDRPRGPRGGFSSPAPFPFSQFSFWGNYLPRMYPTYLRGTGESFAANVGGRMIGTFAAWVTPKLATSLAGGTPTRQLAFAAALVALVVYVGGVVASFWLPEPKRDELPE